MGIISNNLPEAQAYIAALTGSKDTPVTFQTFSEKNKQDGKFTKVLHGNLAEHSKLLSSLNQQGAGIFIMVNEGDLKGREAKNASDTYRH